MPKPAPENTSQTQPSIICAGRELELSSPVVSQAVAKAEEEDRSEQAPTEPSKDSKVRDIDLEAIRERFESSINSTEVRFDVSIKDSGKTSMFFQVVEKKSGKVIRQFPPEELIELAEQQAEAAQNVGRLIEASA